MLISKELAANQATMAQVNTAAVAKLNESLNEKQKLIDSLNKDNVMLRNDILK